SAARVPARVEVALHRRATAATAQPRFQQSVRQQWQSTGFGANIAQQKIEQAGRDIPPTKSGRLFDRPSQVGRLHRTDVELVFRYLRAQFREVGDFGIAVGAQRKQDVTSAPNRGHERGNEVGAHWLGPAKGEKLLEL